MPNLAWQPIPARSLAILLLVVAATTAGCGGPPQLMPTPNLYARNSVDPFPDVPPALRNNRVEVLYLTDRVPEKDSSPENRAYGFKRSRSVAFGVSTVQIGKDVSWDELNKASRTSNRSVKLPMTVTQTREIAVFPPTPRVLFELPAPGMASQSATAPSTLRVEVDEASERCKQELSARLAKSPSKDVYIFVHGYNNDFYGSVTTIAELWHFLGRQGVPIAYSWPAGYGGLRGYTYDRESSEFTVFHLKEMLRAIASCPEVGKIHLIGHSRGTDVVISALRELHLEISGSGRSTRDALKLGTVVLAAPDLDVDVVIQRMVTARLGRVPERFALYVCSKDEALGLSNWLFGGMMRLGKLRSDIFSPEELAALRSSKTMQIVDAQISDAGDFGHNYFHSNPAVSSDLILLLRYGLAPGAANGRPLGVDNEGFWFIDDQYPRDVNVSPAKDLSATRPSAGR